MLPPENATGNFTKIVQRVPVRILLDGDAAALGRAAGPVGDRRRRLRRARNAGRASERSAVICPYRAADAAKVFAFAVMCVGFFIALLDIQIVSSSLREIGGGLSAGPDELAWVQTSYLIAEIIVIPLSGWLSAFCPHAGCSAFRLPVLPHQPVVRHGLGHPQHDRLSRAARFSGRLDDSHRFHDFFPLLPGPPRVLAAARHRRAGVARPYPRPDRRRLDH